jgi:preprotein translocase subunit SecB
MSAESKKTLAARFAELAAAVELLEVRPVGFLAQVVGAIPPPGMSFAVDIKSQLTAKQESEGQFEVGAEFALDAHLEADLKEEFLKLRYTIISRYRVPPEYSLEQDVLDFFAKTNGMVHLWPYLRAFVANSCAQMGIATITLPPFRVQQPAKRLEKKPTPAGN